MGPSFFWEWRRSKTLMASEARLDLEEDQCDVKWCKTRGGVVVRLELSHSFTIFGLKKENKRPAVRVE